MKVFLDDCRTIPRGYVGARSYNDFVQILSKNRGKITDLSLDYNLEELKNGYFACKWIVDNKFFEGLETIIVHSDNPSGQKQMIEFLDKNIPKNIKLFYRDNRNEDIEYKREE